MFNTLIAVASGVGTVASAANATFGLYKNISALVQGNSSNDSVQKIADELSTLRIQVKHLSDRILYAPTLEGVRDLTQRSQRHISNLREVREYLEPVQQALDRDILSSSMIPTPKRLFQVMNKNPYDVLVNIRPVHHAEPSPDSALVPVFFEDREVPYIGWVSRGALPSMFDCEYNELWLPQKSRQSQRTLTLLPKAEDRIDDRTLQRNLEYPQSRVPEWRVEVLDKNEEKIELRVYLNHETHVLIFGTYWNRFGIGTKKQVEVDGEIVNEGNVDQKYFYFSLRDGSNSYNACLETSYTNSVAGFSRKYRLIVGNHTIYTGIGNWRIIDWGSSVYNKLKKL